MRAARPDVGLQFLFRFLSILKIALADNLLPDVLSQKCVLPPFVSINSLKNEDDENAVVTMVRSSMFDGAFFDVCRNPKPFFMLVDKHFKKFF